MKRKDLLTVLTLVTALLFFTAVGAEASPVFVEFSGPYTAQNLIDLGIDPGGVPDIEVCQTVPLTYGYGVPEEFTTSWFFRAKVDLRDFEIYSEVYTFTGVGQYEQFYDTLTTQGDPPKYLHFSGGQGIPVFTYFDITAVTDTLPQGPLPNPEFIMIHPTPVPGALWLLGSALIALVGVRRKFLKEG
jgi:hypothetical protein